MKSTLSIFVMLLVIAAGIAALVWAFLPEPAAVDIAVIERGPLRVTVDEDGKTRIRERYVVSTPLAGRLLRIELDPGDTVEAGKTLLATIEPRDPDLLDPRAVALAEARVRAAEAVLDKTNPEIERARQTQTYAETELARDKKLIEKRAIPQEKYDESVLRARHSDEGLRIARIAQEIARFELEQARAALMHSRPHEGITPSPPNKDWNFQIHAPINGRVLRVLQESTAIVTAGTPLLELGDPTDLEVVVDVLSQDAVAVQPDDRVLLEHWGDDRPLEARVRLVEPAAFTKISTLGVEEQRVNVILDLVDLPDDRRALGDGFRVEARIIVWESDDVLKVPTNALFRHGNDWAVFRVIDGRAKRTTVTIARQNGLAAEITGGLSKGDAVIVHPSDSVHDGGRVLAR